MIREMEIAVERDGRPILTLTGWPALLVFQLIISLSFVGAVDVISWCIR